MKKILAILMLSVFSPPVLALAKAYSLDTYGSENADITQIENDYSSELNAIAKNMQNGTRTNKDSRDFTAKTSKIIEGIKLKNNYSYVGLSPILYPNDPTTYITIDIVQHEDKDRLNSFSAKPNKYVPDPKHLIEKMLAYQKLGFAIFFQTKQFPTFSKCPAHHCTFGFDHPLLKAYKGDFDQVEQYKIQLTNVLKNDQDDNKRAAAAYLLAHINNAKELINILIPAINDPSPLVRNNAMRVIAVVISEHKNIRIPIDKIVKALDFPSTTDRNKALFVTLTLVDRPDYAQYIKTHAVNTLIKLLKLHQPNNHNFAYLILKKISGKNYSQYDYQAWDKWCHSITL